MFLNFVWPEINFQELYTNLWNYTWLVIKAVLILIIGLKVIKWLITRITRRLEKSKIDPSLRSFITPLVSIILKAALFISIVGVFGVEVTSFIAILGSVGFAIGLAFQGSLSNFAGGILILLMKPFRVGDYIEANGFSGTVKDIQIFYTTLVTPDNRKIVIPNANLSNSSLINFSTFPTRRFELKITVSYDNDISKVKLLLESMLNNHELVLKEPIPAVYITGYGSNSIDFSVRGWTNATDFWSVYYDLMYKIKADFDKDGIKIPYQKLDVNLFENKNDSN